MGIPITREPEFRNYTTVSFYFTVEIIKGIESETVCDKLETFKIAKAKARQWKIKSPGARFMVAKVFTEVDKFFIE